jgi:hypothetical protein
MRRTLLIFLMWLVPFQAAWSAGHALHEHLDAAVAHGHAHDHDHSLPDLSEDGAVGHADENHHGGSHGHAAFTFLVTDLAIGLSNTLAAQPPPSPTASFTSHIPLLPDPPPAVRI